MKPSYELTHYYAINKEDYNVKFKTDLNKHHLCQIIAYIQFLTDEIKSAAELEAVNYVLLIQRFYDPELIILNKDVFVEWIIDEYDNWELYCGVAGQILSDAKFHREGLKELIEDLISQN